MRSAPKIFSAVADVIAWALSQDGVNHQLHYLDDFLFLGAPDTSEAAQALESATALLDVPIAVHKTEGPATTLTFLGILIDEHNFQLRLPADKLTRLQAMLQSWSTRKSCRRNELEPLLGHLSHAATVVRHGRIFLRQLFPLLSGTQKHHFIHLRAGPCADLLWWHIFLQGWNGTSFFPVAAPTLEVTSDASGSFGCGASSLHFGWFQVKWPESWHDVNIAAKELVPLVIAASLWGPRWHSGCVRLRCDNMAVLKRHTSRDPLLTHLLCCFILYAPVHQFDFIVEHVPGTHNVAIYLTLFHSLIPQVPHCNVPQAAIDLLVTRRPDWGSQEWTKLFKDTLSRECQGLPTQPTVPVGNATSASAENSQLNPSPSLRAHCASLKPCWPDQ